MAQSAVQPAEKTGQRRPGIRRDLQGLRGLGIVLVVVGHLYRWPQGIFAALDMFFVLSGFLITGLLVDTYARYGKLMFAPFYLGRFRRLMPTAVVTIAVTIGLFYLLTTTARGNEVAEDGLWAFLWVSNWHFAITGTDYFADTTESPLLHFWSLSVEEQYYAVWPVVLLVALLLAKRRKWRTEVVLLGFLLLISAVSFAYSMWHSVADPNVAYYSTLDRVWEFGFGGMLAAGRPWLARIPGWLAGAMGWLAPVGLIVAVSTMEYGVPFPAPWGLVPSILTGMALVAGIGHDTSHLKHLDNRLMVYLGDISYSVYLWHLPINVLLKPFVSGPAYFATAIVLTIVVSVLSYHLLERPLRYAPWLMPRRERVHFARQIQRVNWRRVQVGWTSILVAAVAALAVLSAGSLRAEQAPAPVASFGDADRSDEDRPTALEQQRERIAAALSARDFPAFSPALSALGDWEEAHAAVGCPTVTEATLAECRTGDGDKLALVVGDSAAAAWTPGIREALEPEGWTVQQLTYPMCPSWTLPSYLKMGGAAYPECRRHHDLVEEVIGRERPDLVVLSSHTWQVANAKREELDTDNVGVAYDGLRATLETLDPTRTVVLGAQPILGELLECVTRFGSPDDCVKEPDYQWESHVEGERQAAREHDVPYVATHDWFCVEDRCPAFVGTSPVTSDGAHLTVEYSRALAPLLAEALLAAED